jgi:lipopolysaccharide/colanic/teichoic acid biosynthesis glycosyltransferase
MMHATLPIAPKSINRYPSRKAIGFILRWRQRQLLVLSESRLDPLAASICEKLQNQQYLTECLTRSPVKLVRLDPGLGESLLKHWANAGAQAHKAVFLWLPSTWDLPQRKKVQWGIKRFLDIGAAVALLLMLSPVMLLIALLVHQSSPGSIFFRQWRVGERGKLFQIMKFRTMVVNAEQLHWQVMGGQKGLHKCVDDPRVTPIGHWLRTLSLDELPQLLNVLRGEMSLVGPRPWALYDALRIGPDYQHRMNAMPGITGAWQVEARSNLLDLNAVSRKDLEYLHNWSLWGDLKLLLLTVPRVLAGFGAY